MQTRKSLFTPATVLALFCLSQMSTAGADSWDLTLVSRQRPGDTADARSDPTGIGSADGRYVVFESLATNIVAGVTDSNAQNDVFLYDRVSATTTLVSRALGSATQTANFGASHSAISADGRWVVYATSATNVVSGVLDANGTQPDIYLFDRVSQATLLISHASASLASTASRGADLPTISADGQWIVFSSGATNVVAGQNDSNGGSDLFLFDRVSGNSTLVTHAFGSASQTCNYSVSSGSISADGRRVLFASRATDVVDSLSDDNGSDDAFVFDRMTGVAALIAHSMLSSATTPGGATVPNGISSDGRWVLLTSSAPDIVNGVPNSNFQKKVVLVDRSNATSTLVSRAPNAATATPGADSTGSALSPDGRWVLFSSGAADVINGVSDTNANSDVFLFDRDDNSTTLVSRALGSATSTANNQSTPLSVSADGRRVLFLSDASNVVGAVTDNNYGADVFLFDRPSGTSSLVTRAAGSVTSTSNGSATTAAMSADGEWIAYSSNATDIIAGATDSNIVSDAFLFNSSAASTSLVSRANGTPNATVHDGGSPTAISSDGRWLLFSSRAANVLSGVNDSNDGFDIFLFDRETRSTMLVSRALGSETATPNLGATPATLSPDGRWILFSSPSEDIVPGVVDNNNSQYDIFLFDRTTGDTILVSHAFGLPNTTANRNSTPRGMSADGRWVLFDSVADDMVNSVGDSNSTSDVFLFDRTNREIVPVSRRLGSTAATPSNASHAVAISADGRSVLFNSHATDVMSGVTDSNGAPDLFLFDRIAGTTALVSRKLGSATVTATGSTDAGFLSADGQQVLFDSRAPDIINGVTDANNGFDVFLFDKLTGTTTLVSRSLGFAVTAANRSARASAISPDGRWVLFESTATDVLGGVIDGNGFNADAYVFDRTTGEIKLVSRAVDSPTATADNASFPIALSADGQKVLFRSDAANVVANQADTNHATDVFMFDGTTNTSSLISHRADSATSTGDDYSAAVAMSDDGSVVALVGYAANLVAGTIDSSFTDDTLVAVRVVANLFTDGFE